jgi:hypothetical protein
MQITKGKATLDQIYGKKKKFFLFFYFLQIFFYLYFFAVKPGVAFPVVERISQTDTGKGVNAAQI